MLDMDEQAFRQLLEQPGPSALHRLDVENFDASGP